MIKICGSPLRPLTQAIWPLVLGFQTGETSAPLNAVSRRAPPPLASVTKISGSPERMEEEKASLVPSEDQAGEKLSPPNGGKETGRPRSMEYITICQEFRSPLKATREPSGEMRGESAMLFRCVSCCCPAPS